MTVSVTFVYHRLVPATDSTQSSPLYVLGLSQTAQVQATCTVQRDEWLEVLKTIGWQEYEVFEIPTAPLYRVERFTGALDLLDQAVKAFWAGEDDTCAVRARRALEAAATVNTKQAYEQLWCAVLPDAVDTPKRDALDQFARGIGALRHQAAHGGNLHFQLRRSDAQLALTVAIALFRYLGEELARTSTAG